MSIRKAHGFALIDLLFVCGIVGALCSVALPNLFRARQTAGAASAIGSMRAINSAELTFALTCGESQDAWDDASGQHRSVHHQLARGRQHSLEECVSDTSGRDTVRRRAGVLQ